MPSLRTKPQAHSNPWGAYTGGSVDNDWTMFFGQTRGPIEQSPYDDKKRSTWSLPENMKGRNKYLGDLIELSAIFVDNWYTRVAMPIEFTDAMQATWNVYEFAPKFADLVPERGVTRLVRSSRRSGQAVFQRRGVGFMLTHGFMHSPEGREYYRMNLEQLAQSVIETNNFQVVYAYLTCDDVSKDRYKKFGNRKNGNKTMKDILKVDIDYWDIFKKQKNGGEILDVMVTEQMNLYKGQADMWIMPQKIGMWYTVVPENKTDYWIGGAKAIDTLTDGIDGFRTFGVGKGTSQVYLARTYDIDAEGPIDMLRFPAQIGEFHAMFDQNQGGSYDGYSSRSRSIQVFDEDGDRFTEIPLQFAIENMNRHDANGNLIPIDDKSGNLLYAPAYEKHEVDSDFLHFRDQDGKTQAAAFFGNVRYSKRDIQDWSETLFRALSLVLPTPLNATNNARAEAYNVYKKGINALKLIETIPYNTDRVGSFLGRLVAKLGDDGVSVNNGEEGNVAPSIPLLEVEPNEYGGIDLPDSGGFALPPFFGNWPGFETIANASRTNDVKKLGYNAKLFKDVENFVELLTSLTDSLQQILPDNPVLNPALASSWWRRPSAAGTLFENLVGRVRLPIFLIKGSGGDTSTTVNSRGASRIGAGINSRDATKDSKTDVLAKYSSYTKNAIESVEKALAQITDVIESDATAKKDAKKDKHAEPKSVFDNFGSASNLALDQAEQFITLLKDKDFLSTNLRDVVEEGKARAIIAYAYSQLKLHSGDKLSPRQVLENAQAIAAITSKAITPNVAAPRGSRPAILTSEEAFAAAIANFYGDHPEFNRRSSSARFESSLIRIIKSIDALKEKSADAQDAEEEAAYSVGITRGSGRAAVRGFDADTAVRAPLTISPSMFATYWKTLEKDGGNATFMPASVFNPDLPISATEFAQHAASVIKNTTVRTAGEVHPALRSLAIGTDIGTGSADMGTLGVVNNLVLQENNGGAPVAGNVPSRSSPSTYNIGDHIGKSARAMRRRMAAIKVGEGIEGERRGRSRHTQAHVASHGSEMMDEEESVGGVRGNFYNQGVTDGISSKLIKQLNAPILRQQFLGVEKSAANELYALFQKLFLLTPTNERNFFAFHDKDVMVPVDFLIFRPHARYETYSVIKAKSGRDTGVTYFGNSHFVLGDDAATHVHTGSYVYYSAAVVKEPKNVYVVRNAFVDGYNGGMGVLPYKRGTDSYNPEENKYQSNDPRTSGSVFVVAMPFGSTRNLVGPISTTGKFHKFDESVYDVADEALHYNSAPYYNRFWGWLSNASNEMDLIDSQWRYVNKYASPNRVMHQGHTLYWNVSDGNFTGVRHGTGHWPGETVYPGCAKVRSGTYKAFNIQDYTGGGFHHV